jgi:hypothetical protein
MDPRRARFRLLPPLLLLAGGCRDQSDASAAERAPTVSEINMRLLDLDEDARGHITMTREEFVVHLRARVDEMAETARAMRAWMEANQLDDSPAWRDAQARIDALRAGLRDVLLTLEVESVDGWREVRERAIERERELEATLHDAWNRQQN